MPEKPSERCAIYGRQSDPGQSTLPEQVKWGRGIAESNGWPIAIVATDDGLSGDDLTRPGLAQIEDAFAANHKARCPITRLIVPKTDRLSRSDSLDAFATLAKLRSFGLRYVVTTLRTIDLNSALDRTLYAIEQDHSSNPFLATLGERTLDGMAQVARAGFWIGHTPLGYKLVKIPGEHGAGKKRRSGRLVIDSETAPIVRELFERYAAGESTTVLADWLTAQVRPPRAARWSAHTIAQLLRNEVYIGVRKFGQTSQGKHVRLSASGPVPKGGDEPRDNTEGALVMRCPELALVDEDLFRDVQTLLADGRRRGYRKNALPLPLSGLGKCGSCGAPLHAVVKQNNGTRTRILLCANRMRYGRRICQEGSIACPHDHVLGVIFDLIAKTLLQDGAAERLTHLAEQRADEAQQQAEAVRSSLLRRIADLDATLSRSQRRLAEVSEDMLEDLEAGLRQLRRERDEAKAELKRQDERQAVAKEVDPARFRAFWETCKKAHDLFRQGTNYPPSLRLLLAELIEGFTVYWGKNRRGQSSPQRVDVELPAWLTALASSGIST